MTLRRLSADILNRKTTSAALTAQCLSAILSDDRAGHALNAVCEINPDALFEARARDQAIRKNGLKSPLDGIPVLIKDNIDVKNMHTCAGSLALADNIAIEDAFCVKKLREAGAVILGKTNLSEFAYFMSTQGMPNGYSSLGGQVLNAHDPSCDPQGSSSGSAVAVSAEFAPYAIGTETDGSLMSPAAANSIVAIKPTVGLVSRHGILPISHVQDTAGPMGTSVADAADVLTILAGYDKNDAATYTCRPQDYRKALYADCADIKAGLLYNEEDELSEYALRDAAAVLKAHGASVVKIEAGTARLNDLPAMTHEFHYGIDLYLSSHTSAMRSLKDIVEFNRAHAEECLVYGQDLLESALRTNGRLNDPEYLENRLYLERESRRILRETMAAGNINVIISAGRRAAGNLAPVSGAPCLSLPARSTDDSHYRPLNFCLTAGAYREDILIHTAYTLEQELRADCTPAWLKG